MSGSNILLGMAMGIAVSAIVIIVIEVVKRVRGGGHLFLGGHRNTDKDPDNLGDRNKWSYAEDGPPGGNRGRVWTDLERSEYRQAQERKKLRIIQ